MDPKPLPTHDRLPRWRGFNLLEKFNAQRGGPFRESDFDLVAEWGFDFVRLPMSYQCWAKPDPAEWLKLDEKSLAHVDQAIEYGRKRSIHVNLNLHRAPGYCVNPPKEPLDLWTDDKALDACAFHWAHLARRYKGISNDRVSFDLLNEPPNIEEAKYLRVARRLVEAIRAEDPGRLIIADGLMWGQKPMHSFVDLKVAQSTRGYQPMGISHWKATWVKGSETWPAPTWPLNRDKQVWDRNRLKTQNIEPWQAIERKGVGVHVGEWGAFKHTPHHVVLAWMKDNLELWKQAGWGWALWNLRGSFGVLDSERADVKYDDFRGHRLDRRMLELLKEG